MSAVWRITCLTCCGVLGLTFAILLASPPSKSSEGRSFTERLASWASVPRTSPSATIKDDVPQVATAAAPTDKPELTEPKSNVATNATPPLAYPQTALVAPEEPVRTPSVLPSASLTIAAPLPRVAQQVVPEISSTPLPPIKPAAEKSATTIPGPALAAAPDLSEAMKLIENMDPATRQSLLEQGVKALDGGKLKQIESLLNGGAPILNADPQTPPPPRPKDATEPEPLPPGKSVDDRKATVTHMPGFDVGDDHLVLNIHNTDLKQVLELLAEQGGLNILASPSVQGVVSASLRDVNIETALDAILKSSGFISRREGKLIFVGTPEEFSKLRTDLDRVGVRVYRLNYVTAKEIQNLITSLLTPNVGKATVTSAANTGIAVDATTAGGDAFASGEAVVVQDYEAILCQVDEIVREIDRKPLQVAIEAVIVSVTLNDTNKWGVDFQFLRDQNTVRFGTGTPRTSALNGNGTPDGTGGMTGEFKFTQGGLQFAFLDSTLGMFLTAVETLGDVNVVAHPRLLCLNKQKAEILIGAQIGYVTTNVTQTFSTQSVQFLDVGTQLRLRPFISNDGVIRLEVHPEISDGTVSATGVPSKNVTQVTTNIMCPDSATVVIGGLMQESLQADTTQVPVIGSMPVIGPLFRTKTEKIIRREILVLITPRIIYDPEASDEGRAADLAAHRGQNVVGDELTLLSRTYQSRLLMRRAEEAQRNGNLVVAWRHAQTAVHFNPNNHDAVALRDSLEQQIGRTTVRSAGPPSSIPPVSRDVPLNMAPLDGDNIPPWVLDALEGAPAPEFPLPHPRDPGGPTKIRAIKPVDVLEHDAP